MKGIVEYSGTLAGSLCFVASGSWHALFRVELTHVSTKGEGTRSTREPGKSYRLLRREVRDTCAQEHRHTLRLRVWFLRLAVSV